MDFNEGINEINRINKALRKFKWNYANKINQILYVKWFFSLKLKRSEKNLQIFILLF